MTYDLAEDHASIKKQIKKWERKIDALIQELHSVNVTMLVDKQNPSKGTTTTAVAEALNVISDEMMAINI